MKSPIAIVFCTFFLVLRSGLCSHGSGTYSKMVAVTRRALASVRASSSGTA